MESAGIFTRYSSTLDSVVQIGVASQKVVSVDVTETSEEDVGSDHEVMDRLFAYFEGEKDDFRDLDIALTVPTDQRAVLETARQIPYGEQISVEELGRMTPGLDPEDEDSRSIVRTALAENPLPIIIPDHRVRDGPSGMQPHLEEKVRQIEGL